MKPCNFPGRVALRKARAHARENRLPRPDGDPTVVSIKWRFGASLRGPDGVARVVPA